MKIKKVTVRRLILIYSVALCLSAVSSCSSSDESSGDVEASSDSEAVTDGEPENSALSQNTGNKTNNSNKVDGEAVNNSTEKDSFGAQGNTNSALLNSQTTNQQFSNSSQQSPNVALQNTAPANNATGGAENAAAPTNGAAPLNIAPANAAAPTNAFGGVQPASNTAAAPTISSSSPLATPPEPGGIVRYVKVPRLDIYNRPTNAAPSNSIQMGDHPVTYAEGEWMKMHDGRYIKSQGMSDQGVARPRKAHGWH